MKRLETLAYRYWPTDTGLQTLAYRYWPADTGPQTLACSLLPANTSLQALPCRHWPSDKISIEFVEFCALSDCGLFICGAACAVEVTALVSALFFSLTRFVAIMMAILSIDESSTTANNCLQNSGSCGTAVQHACNSTARLPVSHICQNGCSTNLQR